jgi:DNA-binding response OmpR family regulator/nucleoside-diphosphate-sugar epimerase
MNEHNHLLLIEDDVSFQKTLRNALKKKGYSVFSAGNENEAIEAAQKNVFKLIISDVRLPGNEDGIKVVEKIKRIYGQSKAKVLIITGYADTEAPIRAIKVGVADYFIKPFVLEEFMKKVKECLCEEKPVGELDLANQSFDQRLVFLKRLQQRQRARRLFKKGNGSQLKIAITGATGLIGSNLLFEIIKQNLSNLNKLQIFILGRSFPEENFRRRIWTLWETEGKEYISTNKKDHMQVESRFDDIIKCVHINLGKDHLELSKEDFNELKKDYIDVFYHVAASTDLRPGMHIECVLQKVNVDGTLRILELIGNLKLKEFCYVGTAYSCGMVSGTVMPDFINWKQIFRNPYEKSKLAAEILVREYAKNSKIKFRYFRPSVTCGRLLEKPLGAVNKFDVIYGWGAFFLAMKRKQILKQENLYKEKVHFDVRICFKRKSGLNIVPADYVAKIMYAVFISEDKSESYHVVNTHNTSHSLYLFKMLDSFNIKGFRQIDEIPSDLNKLEQTYYKTVGKIFTPYINAEPMIFNTDNLDAVVKKNRIYCPKIDKANLSKLIRYAKRYDFGII